MKLHFVKQCSPIILLSCVCLFATGTLQAQQRKQQSRNWATVWDWAAAPWDGNEKTYQQMRATIDNAITSGRKPQDLVYLYENTARQNLNDPKAQFKRAYAAYLAAKQTDDAEGERILGEPMESLILAPFPKTYEYARLIFLVEDYVGMPNFRLQEVSKRLLRRNPSDTTVKYAAARNLLFSANPADRNLAYQYVHEILVVKPDWASPHGFQGFIYYKRWQSSKNKDVASKSIAEYQQYLRLDTLQDPDFRKRVQETIAEMQKG
jgi:hypothetical protein